MTKEQAMELVEATAAKLGEHFDAVQIMVSWLSWPADGGGTNLINRGCGNWYARQGMAHELIENGQGELRGGVDHDVAEGKGWVGARRCGV